MQNKDENMNFTKELINFIDKSPSAYHAVENASDLLLQNGFCRLDSSKRFSVSMGGKYFLTRGGSSLIAFKLPEKLSKPSFSIGATHSDSPAFKLKYNCETDAFGVYTKLSVERYGGMIRQSWFDRPLSIAGRITYSEDGKIVSKNVNIDKDLLIIPSVPPHLSSIKEPALNVDFLPLFAQSSSNTSFADIISEYAKIGKEEIISYDLFVYCRQKGTFIGSSEEFFASPRIDNLECSYSLLSGLIEAAPKDSIPVFAMFDSEETGSSSREGALSTFLPETLKRLCFALGYDEEDYYTALADSFMASADNAHARHPNHPELFDTQNAPNMNGGVVIKSNASHSYTTDAVSYAIVKKICEIAGVPCQTYANRADIAGGSTLGNIALRQLPVCSADIGLAQLAMHSSVETAGTFDAVYMKMAAKALFESAIYAEADKGYGFRK